MTLDVRTFRRELDAWLARGLIHPGVVWLRQGQSVANIVDLLETMSYASVEDDWRNAFRMIGPWLTRTGSSRRTRPSAATTT